MTRGSRILLVLFALFFLTTLPHFSWAQGTSPDLQITHHSPEGENDGQVQVQVLFNKPVVPLGTLDDPARKDVLAHFSITPKPSGAFRLLGTNAVVFEAAHHLTLATEYRVTVLKGIKAVDGSVLQSDLIWTFRTPGPRIEFINPNSGDHVVPDQRIAIVSNQALSVSSLNEHVRFVETRFMAKEEPVAYEVFLSKDNPKEADDIGMERRQYRYEVKPRSPLKLDTKYSLTVQAGVRAKEGNLTTPAAVTASFKTYGPFRFLRVEPQRDGYYNNLYPSYQLVFSNGVSQEEMDKSVLLKEGEKATITDKLLGFFEKVTKGREKRRVRASAQGSLFSAYQRDIVPINNASLNPDTDYELTLLKDLTDIYGQKLENPQDARFHSGDLQAAVVARQGMYVVSKKVNPVLPVGVQAVDKLYMKVVGLNPVELLETDDRFFSLSSLLKKSRGDYSAVPGIKEKNKPERHDIDLKPKFNQDGFGAVLYDFYAPEEARRWKRRTNDQIHHTGLIFRTDLGVQVKLSPKEGLLLANSLATGEPVSGVKVSAYRDENKLQPCASGTTDSTGLLVFGQKELSACTKRKITNKALNEERPAERDENEEAYDRESYGDARPPKLSLIVSKGTDWTFLQARGEGNPPIWNFGVTPAWEAERPIAAGTIFSDRRIYRLGETVELKGVVRYLSYGELKKEVGAAYDVELRDPHGARTKLSPVKVSEYGTFNISIPLKKNQPLGHYTITASSKTMKLRYQGTFQVAQFRAPDFKARVTLAKSRVIAGEDLKAEVKAEYYFGAPMAGSRTSWNVTRRRTISRPEGWEGMFFGIPDWIDREGNAAEPSANVASNVLDLDREGKGSITIAVPKGDVTRPMLYNFDIEVKDPSEQTVGASGMATVLPYPVLAGMKIGDWFGEAKKPLAVSVLAVDPDGKPKPGTAMLVKLIKRDWHAVRKVIRPGQESTETQMVDSDTDTCEVASAEKPVTCTVTPPSAGYYIVQTGFKDRGNTGAEAKLTFYASGREMVGWSGTEYDRVEVLLDKDKYAPGETARALIKSPYPAAEMLFTIEREKFFVKKRQLAEGGAVVVEFTVTKEMIPNAYVGVALIRKGAPASGLEAEDDHQFKVGYAPFTVSAEEKRLQVIVSPEKKNSKPAEDLRVDFLLKDQSGKPASGELVVMVVDESILALTGYTPPDLVSIIYPHRGLSMRMSDNRRFLLHQQKFSEKGNDGGGGDMMAPGVSVRQLFQNLAYYNPSLITNADGKASITFKLPDNLTQWRIMAVAITKDDRFGDGKAGVTVALPLVSRPVVPRFTRLGDRFKAGVTVQVSGEAGGEATISASLPDKNSAIAFTGSDKDLKTTVSIKAGETRKVLFPYVARTAGTAPLRFVSHFEGKDKDGKTVSHDDAVQMTLAVQDLPPTETTVAVGETEKESLEKLNIPSSGIRPDSGGLSISLASTALAQLDEGAQYLVKYPYGCLEQTASLLLPLMELQELSKAFTFDLQASKPIPEVIKANLAKVLSLQNADGGFKYWTSDRDSDPWISPYIAKLLTRAEELHYDVPKEAKEKLGVYLKDKLRNIPWYMRLCSWRCVAYYRMNILMGMRYLGLSDESYYQDYFNRRKELSFDTNIRLCALLSQLPNWKAQSAVLFEEIKKALFITATTAHIEDRAELPGSWNWMSSPVINTSQALDLFLMREPNNPFAAKMARYILNARKNGRWRYTYENAAALDALLMVLKKKEKTEPDYIATVLLAGKKVLEAERKGYDTKLSEGRVEAKDLPAGKSDLLIKKKGKGTLYYTLRYSYKLLGPQPARQEGFYVERTISRFDPAKATAEERESLKEIPLGQVAIVELTMIVPQAGYRFVVDDPLPAGLEPIDTSLKTTSKRYETDENEQGGGANEYGWKYNYNPFNHVERHDDGVKLFADEISAGVYHYKYMARATTPGVFELPGTTATLMYEPEQFGRGAEGTFSVSEP